MNTKNKINSNDSALSNQEPTFFDDLKKNLTLKEEDEAMSPSEKRALRKITKDQSLIDNNIILSVRHLKKFFKLGSGLEKTKLKAVHDVSFDVKKGEVFGLVGESGCGKTTTGRCIIRLHDLTSGSIYFKGYRISAGSRWNEKEIKWSRLKGEKKIKELEMAKKDAISDMSNVTEADKKNIQAIQHSYDLQIEEIRNRMRKIREVEKEKIKRHKYDDSHVDKHLLTKIQMIFQDPIDSLDPRMTVEDIIQEGLKIQKYASHETKKLKEMWDLEADKVRENSSLNEEQKSAQIQALNEKYRVAIQDARNYHKKVSDVLLKVGLIPEYASRYPHEFSGGQRQRIGIARALVMQPELIIADEPISALDVSIRAQIINLLNELREEMGLTILFIAHDLSVVKYFCNRIAVMYFGSIVELASSDELFKHPLHPYTKSLLSAIPRPDPLTEKSRKRIKYDPATAHDYSVEKPWLQEIEPGHFVLANTAEMEKYRQEIKAEDANPGEIFTDENVKPSNQDPSFWFGTSQLEEKLDDTPEKNAKQKVKEAIEEPIVKEVNDANNINVVINSPIEVTFPDSIQEIKGEKKEDKSEAKEKVGSSNIEKEEAGQVAVAPSLSKKPVFVNPRQKVNESMKKGESYEQARKNLRK